VLPVWSASGGTSGEHRKFGVGRRPPKSSDAVLEPDPASRNRVTNVTLLRHGVRVSSVGALDADGHESCQTQCTDWLIVLLDTGGPLVDVFGSEVVGTRHREPPWGGCPGLSRCLHGPGGSIWEGREGTRKIVNRSPASERSAVHDLADRAGLRRQPLPSPKSSHPSALSFARRAGNRHLSPDDA